MKQLYSLFLVGICVYGIYGEFPSKTSSITTVTVPVPWSKIIYSRVSNLEISKVIIIVPYCILYHLCKGYHEHYGNKVLYVNRMKMTDLMHAVWTTFLLNNTIFCVHHTGGTITHPEPDPVLQVVQVHHEDEHGYDSFQFGCPSCYKLNGTDYMYCFPAGFFGAGSVQCYPTFDWPTCECECFIPMSLHQLVTYVHKGICIPKHATNSKLSIGGTDNNHMIPIYILLTIS